MNGMIDMNKARFRGSHRLQLIVFDHLLEEIHIFHSPSSDGSIEPSRPFEISFVDGAETISKVTEVSPPPTIMESVC